MSNAMWERIAQIQTDLRHGSGASDEDVLWLTEILGEAGRWCIRRADRVPRRLDHDRSRQGGGDSELWRTFTVRRSWVAEEGRE